jgi:hypothetical protein
MRVFGPWPVEELVLPGLTGGTSAWVEPRLGNKDAGAGEPVCIEGGNSAVQVADGVANWFDSVLPGFTGRKFERCRRVSGPKLQPAGWRRQRFIFWF